MGKNLNELGLRKDVVAVDVGFDDLPTFGGGRALLQPGRYIFTLPTVPTIWGDPIDHKDGGQRIQAAFDADTPLTIVQSPGGQHNDEPYEGRVSNYERNRGRQGEQVLVSDMDYLLRLLGEQRAKGERWTNQEYARRLLQHLGKTFPCNLTISWSCNPKRNIYVDDGQGGIEEVEGTLGCGTRYYTRDVQKVEGAFPERIVCGGNNGSCGASVRGFNDFDFAATRI